MFNNNYIYLNTRIYNLRLKIISHYIVNDHSVRCHNYSSSSGVERTAYLLSRRRLSLPLQFIFLTDGQVKKRRYLI